MSMEKLFICLANSKKLTERCIAGIELVKSVREGYKYDVVRTEDNNPKWIRPISEAESGAVSSWLVKDINLLDIVKINVTKPTPQGYQSENVLFDGKPPAIIDTFKKTPSLIEELLSVNEAILFGNKDRSISVRHITKLGYSLVLIEPSEVDAHITTNWRGDDQTRARFVFNGNSYNLPITDIDFIHQFRYIPTLLDSCTHVYFTVSLGVEFNQQHYKLIAGVVYF